MDNESRIEAIRRIWTPERRAYLASVVSTRQQKEHAKRALAAGVPLEWKFCAACSTWKPRAEYHKDVARHDGVHNRCKTCRARYAESEAYDGSRQKPL